jgi:hypothetical protein
MQPAALQRGAVHPRAGGAHEEKEMKRLTTTKKKKVHVYTVAATLRPHAACTFTRGSPPPPLIFSFARFREKTLYMIHYESQVPLIYLAPSFIIVNTKKGTTDSWSTSICNLSPFLPPQLHTRTRGARRRQTHITPPLKTRTSQSHITASTSPPLHHRL